MVERGEGLWGHPGNLWLAEAPSGSSGTCCLAHADLLDSEPWRVAVVL